MSEIFIIILYIGFLYYIRKVAEAPKLFKIRLIKDFRVFKIMFRIVEIIILIRVVVVINMIIILFNITFLEKLKK